MHDDLYSFLVQQLKQSMILNFSICRLYIMALLGRHSRHSPIQERVIIECEHSMMNQSQVSYRISWCRKDNAIVDVRGKKIRFYEQVPEILKKLYDEGYELGVASRTSEIRGAFQLLDLFGWDKYFKYKEIYPGCKVTHFNK